MLLSLHKCAVTKLWADGSLLETSSKKRRNHLRALVLLEITVYGSDMPNFGCYLETPTDEYSEMLSNWHSE